MAEQKTVYLTKEGLDKLEKELHKLRTKDRMRIANEIAEARAQGDLSENAEYDAAKEAQGHLEARIAHVENTLANARLVDEDKIDASKAYILSRVKIKNHDRGATQTVTLVSAEEANAADGKISVTSPIGKGLLGKEKGDKVEINAPAGTMTFEIMDISR